MTVHNYPSPEKVEDSPLVLGESIMPAEPYVRELGGLLIKKLGNIDALDPRLVDTTYDQETGMVHTLDHAAMAAQAHAIQDYVDERSRQSAHERQKTGLRARFADFQEKNAPSAVFELFIEPEFGADVQLWSEEIVYENGTQVGVEGRVEVTNPKILLEAVLFDLSKYHLVNETLISLHAFRRDQQARTAETSIGDYYTDNHGWLRRRIGKR